MVLIDILDLYNALIVFAYKIRLSLHFIKSMNCQLLNRIPEILWYQVFKNLTILDFVRLRLVSQKLKVFVSHYVAIYERECLRIFTSNLDFYSYFS